MSLYERSLDTEIKQNRGHRKEPGSGGSEAPRERAGF